MTLTVEARVTNGAEYLDSVWPDWWRQIDLGLLDLSDGCRCILGQIVAPLCTALGWSGVVDEFVGFSTAISAIARRKARDLDEVLRYYGGWAADHGFLAGAMDDNIDGVSSMYRALDEAWIALIKERFETQ